MKILITLFIALVSLNTFAGDKMGTEAVEMFSVMSHANVQECMREVPSMVNIKIEKMTARCPGCNVYTITGNELRIDVPTVKRIKIVIKGKGVRSSFGGFTQTYTCEVL
jgi:hypothetical protein